MEATLTQNIDQIKDHAFLPLSTFLEILEREEPFPYQTQFSFDKYIDVIGGKLSNACSHTKSALLPLIEHNSVMLKNGEITLEQMAASPEFQTIISLVIPSMLFSSEKAFICPPFVKKNLARTKAFDELFNDTDWELSIASTDYESKKLEIIRQAGFQILNKFYGQNIKQESGRIFTIRNKNTKIEKHFQTSMKHDFVEIENVKALKPLSQNEINLLLKATDVDTWLEYLPADAFKFKGFVVGNLHEVTELEVVSRLKNWLSTSIDEKVDPKEFLAQIGEYVKSYIQEEDLEMGMVLISHNKFFNKHDLSLSGLNNLKSLLASEKKNETKGVYDHVFEKKTTVYIEDIKDLQNPSHAEKKLLKNKVRSIILYPILSEQGELISILEFGSEKNDTFNAFILERLRKVFQILTESFEKFVQDIDNSIATVIQQNFTSIHPSVSWKFENVALDYFIQRQEQHENPLLQPIVFKDVSPLYGQADIVSSSYIRNEAIGADLIKNLELLSNLLMKWFEVKEIHLLESYKLRVDKLIAQIKKKFVSTEESSIVNLLTNEIHPVLHRMAKRHTNLPMDAYQDYLEHLDPKLGIVYEKRKEFEMSVMKLNNSISNYLETEESKMQDILPHFFEKYKTDGVEYNIYLGQSILENGKFYDTDLRNFKMWQLSSMCEITRLVKKISPELHVPLTTAQLIFVYNSSLGIKFRMDEKKFDVDGAYNVRYEILKKRIDKAVIAGTNKRLTESGKIAIVYLTSNDKAEYMEFLEYLVDKKMISPEIEDLSLAKLQGAEGLKALRVTVLDAK